jgi:hypothetical protein
LSRSCIVRRSPFGRVDGRAVSIPGERSSEEQRSLTTNMRRGGPQVTHAHDGDDVDGEEAEEHDPANDAMLLEYQRRKKEDEGKVEGVRRMGVPRV